MSKPFKTISDLKASLPDYNPGRVSPALTVTELHAFRWDTDRGVLLCNGSVVEGSLYKAEALR